jgi:hypothetical protein
MSTNLKGVKGEEEDPKNEILKDDKLVACTTLVRSFFNKDKVSID